MQQASKIYVQYKPLAENVSHHPNLKHNIHKFKSHKNYNMWKREQKQWKEQGAFQIFYSTRECVG